MTRMILILSSLLFAFAANSQKYNEHFIDIQGNDFLNDIISTVDGNYVAVGTTQSRFKKGQEILLIKFDPNSNLVFKKQIGTRSQEMGRAVELDIDGGYIIAGSRASQPGEKLAWLVKTNARGEVLFDKILSTGTNTILNSLAVLNNKYWVVGGSRNNKAWISIINRKGDVELEETFAEYTNLTDILVLDRKVFVTLNSNGKKSKGAIKQLDESLVENWNYNKRYNEFNKIKTKNNELLAVGTALTTRNREQIALVSLDINSGKENYYKNFGGRDLDQGLSFEVSEDVINVIGSSRSYSRGARREKLAIWSINLKSQALENISYLGSNSENHGLDLIKSPWGQLMAIGQSNSYNSDAWIISKEYEPVSSVNLAGLEIESSHFYDYGGDQILSVGESGHLQLSFRNKSQEPIHYGIARLHHQNNFSGINFPDSIYLGEFHPGEIKTVCVPLESNDKIQTGTEKVFLFVEGWSKAHQISISLLGKEEAILEIADVNFTSEEDGYLRKGEESILKIEIHNNGTVTSDSTFAKFTLPYLVVSPSKQIVAVPEISANGKYVLELPLVLDEAFAGNEIKVNLILSHPRLGLQLEEDCTFPVETPYFTAREDSLLAEGNEFLEINWLSPDIPLLNSNHNKWDQEEITIQAVAISDKPLAYQDFELLRNGELYEAGIKSDVVSLKRKKNTNKGFKYIYQSKVILAPGKNELRVNIKNNLKEAKTENILLEYVPPKPNLFVFSIGIEHPDLKYTQQDAKDFAALFPDQEGKLFEEVHIELINTPDLTNTQSLKYKFQDIQNRYNADIIKPNDVVWVFVSSHGRVFEDTGEQSFRLLCSDFKELYPKQSSLDFKADILEVMQPMACKKILMIDACQSGAISDFAEGTKAPSYFTDISEAVIQLAENSVGFETLLSCSAQEYSYEHKNWKNGAFTESLVYFLGTEEGQTIADKNEDQVITMDELYLATSVKVKALIKEIYKGSKSQNPYLLSNKTGELPIFVK